MQVSPKAAMAIKVVLTLAVAIGNGSLALTGLVSNETALKITVICQFFVAAVGVGMNAFSSSAPGPLAPQDAPVVVAAQRLADLPPSAPPRTIEEAKNAVKASADRH